MIKTGEHTVLVTRYLHGEEDEYSDLWPNPGEEDSTPQTEAAQDEYHYSLYEVRIDLEVDLRTGKSAIVAVDGKLLSNEKAPWR